MTDKANGNVQKTKWPLHAAILGNIHSRMLLLRLPIFLTCQTTCVQKLEVNSIHSQNCLIKLNIILIRSFVSCICFINIYFSALLISDLSDNCMKTY